METQRRVEEINLINQLINYIKEFSSSSSGGKKIGWKPREEWRRGNGESVSFRPFWLCSHLNCLYGQSHHDDDNFV